MLYSANSSFSNCNFTNNLGGIGSIPSDYGGAVNLHHSDNCHFLNCNFANNSMNVGYCGAIFVDGSDYCEFSNCNFTNNSASQAGAIFFVSSDNGSVSGCIFINNTANVGGGAIIYWDSDNGSASACVFMNNAVNHNGGAIFGTSSLNGTISDCRFVNNIANQTGGAISWAGSNTKVLGCSFIDNSANETGGCICWNVDNGVVSNCSFIDNSANVKGSAIYWMGNNGVVSSCIFINNTASTNLIYYPNDHGFENLTINNNIFLNNNCFEFAFNKTDSTLNTDYNWFGHNATDYVNNPNLPNCKIWLFFNATVNPNPVSILFASELTFKLFAYDSTSGDILEYDNSLLKPINLTISVSDGGVSENITCLGKSVKYDPSNLGNYSATATLENLTVTVNLTVVKDSTGISSNDLTTTYQDDQYLVVNVRDSRDNPVRNAYTNITINGVTYTCWTDANGNAELVIRLKPNDYVATVTFDEDNKRSGATQTVKVTVKKSVPKIVAKAKTFKKSAKTKKYTVNLKDNTGKAIKKARLTLKVKGKTYKAKTNSKGKATFKITKLTKKGTFKAVIKFKGNEYYNAVSKKVKIKIK